MPDGGCGVKVAYDYPQSDEISLLFGPDDDGFGRKLRNLLSILSGEASAQFSLLLCAKAVIDCRISQLPSTESVVDYFCWRAEDAHRNAPNARCYWLLRRQGRDVVQATEALRGLAKSDEARTSGPTPTSMTWPKPTHWTWIKLHPVHSPSRRPERRAIGKSLRRSCGCLALAIKRRLVHCQKRSSAGDRRRFISLSDRTAESDQSTFAETWAGRRRDRRCWSRSKKGLLPPVGEVKTS